MCFEKNECDMYFMYLTLIQIQKCSTNNYLYDF